MGRSILENLEAILAGLGAILRQFGVGWEAKNIDFPLVFQLFLQNRCFEQKWSSWLVLSPSWVDVGPLGAILVSPSLPSASDQIGVIWPHPPFSTPKLTSTSLYPTQLNLTHFLTLRGAHFGASWAPKIDQRSARVAS